ncbi:L10-interacting MYB domain-containing protein [Bienertia sinuspersici]
MKASTSLKWIVNMDKVFLNALIAEEVNGNRVDGHFTSKAYENAVKECNEKLGHRFTKENLKNHLKTIKKWGLNEQPKMFESDDEVCKDLIKKKPEAVKWKKTSFHQYDLLLKLFSKDRAPGELAATAKEKKIKAMGESSVDNQEESVGELPRPC